MKVKATICAIAFSMLALSAVANAENSHGELSKKQQVFAEKKDDITHASDFIYVEGKQKDRVLFQSEVKKDSAKPSKSSAN